MPEDEEMDEEDLEEDDEDGEDGFDELDIDDWVGLKISEYFRLDG